MVNLMFQCKKVHLKDRFIEFFLLLTYCIEYSSKKSKFRLLFLNGSTTFLMEERSQKSEVYHNNG